MTSMPKAIVFDLYGTLYDVHSVAEAELTAVTGRTIPHVVHDGRDGVAQFHQEVGFRRVGGDGDSPLVEIEISR